MPYQHLGELAALGTACCWTASALAFESAGRRIGSLTVNLLRMGMALLLLMLVVWVADGAPVPGGASVHNWVWLSISGLVGFTFGDLCLFRAFVILGSRLSTLVMSVVPLLTALLGWLALGEILSRRDFAGMVLIVSGIAWAIYDRGRARGGLRHPSRPVVGLLLALGGALGQGGGLVLSKYGMGGYDPLAANLIRVVAGFAGYLGLFGVLRGWRWLRPAFADVRALAFTSVGAVFGPFLGVSLSLIAIRHTQTGVAASLMSTTPVLIIPAAIVLRKERVGPGGFAGALLAVAGAVLLFR